MEFLVKSNQPFYKGYKYTTMSISFLLGYFDPQMDDDEVYDMIDSVFALNINETYAYSFFGGNEYIFKRIK